MEDYFNQESERLLIRGIVKSDIILWEEFFVQKPNLKFLGLDDSRAPQDLAQEWVNRQLERYSKNEMGLLIAFSKTTGDLIGMGGLIPREIKGSKELEVAYSIIPSHWKKGFATEIAMHMKSFAKRNKLSDRVVSMIHPENEGSIKVAYNNGMEKLFNHSYMGIPVEIYGVEFK